MQCELSHMAPVFPFPLLGSMSKSSFSHSLLPVHDLITPSQDQVTALLSFCSNAMNLIPSSPPSPNVLYCIVSLCSASQTWGLHMVAGIRLYYRNMLPQVKIAQV